MTHQTIIQLAVTLFPAALFLQSGLDKLFDMKGNRDYIQGVFEHTILKPFSLLMFFGIMVLEVATGVQAAAGAVILAVNGDPEIARRAFYMGAAAILMLFAGQRIAKDYVGAAGIVPYFLVMLAGLFLLS